MRSPEPAGEARRRLLKMRIIAVTALLVLTNLPDRVAAEALASELVAARLAALINVLAPCRSVYRWQGVIETADEVRS